MSQFKIKALVSCLFASMLVSCGDNNEITRQQPTAEINLADTDAVEAITAETRTAETSVTDASENDATQWEVSEDMSVPADQIGTDKSLASVLGAVDIPYPVYPNSSKYRIGGENGLKIVLFQTEDSFEQVDAFFQSQANLPRLSAMTDYVRYSINPDDQDPWETTNPGIVIHQFNDADERQTLGADGDAVTNIIMSFQ